MRINHKYKASNNKQNTMTKMQNQKQYDLEERTLEFAKNVITFTKVLPRTVANRELVKQLVRSCGSVGANYIEANESLSKKDFVMRIKICRKEAKESAYWLKLVEINAPERERERAAVIEEATQLLKIFSAILEKSK
jgi:four helix bundle protein